MLVFEICTWLLTAVTLALVETDGSDGAIRLRALVAAGFAALAGGLLGHSAQIPGVTLGGYSVLALACAAAAAQLVLVFVAARPRES